MNAERANIVGKVQKLLALSKSDNQHEAELAAKRASELMEKYQIAESEAALTDAKKIDVDTSHYDVPGLRMKYNWVTRLTWASAVLFDCEVLDCRSLHGVRVLFIGYPEDIEMAKSMFEYLYNAWGKFVWRDLAAAKAEVRALGRSFAPRDTMKYKLGHGQGYAEALLNRARALQRERHATVEESSSTGRELVVVKDTAVAEMTAKMTGGRKSSSREKWGYRDGVRDGRAKGNTVALGGSIAGNSTKMIEG